MNMNKRNNEKSKANRPTKDFKGQRYTKGKDDRFSKPDTTGSNDISWYMHDPSLVEAAGRLNFNNPLGNTIAERYKLKGQGHLTAADSSLTIVEGKATGLPDAIEGICVLMCSPYYGVADSPNSPINVAARAAFGRMRSTLSTSNLGFDASDLMAYFIAVDNLFSYYAWMSRLYGIASTANVLNRYEGRKMIFANGVDYDDLVQHYSDLRYYTRVFAKKVNAAIRMPKGYGITERHFWLFSNVFKDGAVDKSQYYMHVPTGFYRWASTLGNGGSGAEYISLQTPMTITQSAYELKPTSGGINPLKVEDIIAYGNILLNALLTEDDVAMISGMVLRTYGTEGTYVLKDMDDEYSVVPVYNEEILEQIHNTTFVGCCPRNINWKDEQGNNEWYYSLTPSGDDSDMLHYVQSNSGNADTYLVSTPHWVADYTPTSQLVPSKVTGCHINAMAFGGAYQNVLDSRKDIPDAATVMIDSRNILGTDVVVDGYGAAYSVDLKAAGLEIYYFGLMVGYLGSGYKFDNSVPSLFAAAAFGSSIGFAGIKDYVNSVSGMTAQTAFRQACSVASPTLSTLANFDWAPRVQVLYTNGDSDGSASTIDFVGVADVWEYNNYTYFSRDTLIKLHEAALMGAFAMPIQTHAWKG